MSDSVNNPTIEKYLVLVHAIRSLTERGIAREEVFTRLGELLDELGFKNLAADCRKEAGG